MKYLSCLSTSLFASLIAAVPIPVNTHNSTEVQQKNAVYTSVDDGENVTAIYYDDGGNVTALYIDDDSYGIPEEDILWDSDDFNDSMLSNATVMSNATILIDKRESNQTELIIDIDDLGDWDYSYEADMAALNSTMGQLKERSTQSDNSTEIPQNLLALWNATDAQIQEFWS